MIATILQRPEYVKRAKKLLNAMRSTGYGVYHDDSSEVLDLIAHSIQEAVAQEREVCAKVADESKSFWQSDAGMRQGRGTAERCRDSADGIASVIRARGKL